MLQLDRYWSLDIWLDSSNRFTVDSSNPMSWFRPFASCCRPRYIFQALCLHHIVERRLNKTALFFMFVRQPKYKGVVAFFVAVPCWFRNPLLHNSLCLIFYSLVIKINFIDCRCHWSWLSILFSHCFRFWWECWLEGFFWLARCDRKIDKMIIGLFKNDI